MTRHTNHYLYWDFISAVWGWRGRLSWPSRPRWPRCCPGACHTGPGSGPQPHSRHSAGAWVTSSSSLRHENMKTTSPDVTHGHKALSINIKYWEGLGQLTIRNGFDSSCHKGILTSSVGDWFWLLHVLTTSWNCSKVIPWPLYCLVRSEIWASWVIVSGVMMHCYLWLKRILPQTSHSVSHTSLGQKPGAVTKITENFLE